MFSPAFNIDKDMATRRTICGPLVTPYLGARPRFSTSGRGYACAAVGTTFHPLQTARTTDPSVMLARRALFAHALSLSVLAISPGLAAPPSYADAEPGPSINVDPSNFDFPVIELPKDFVELAYDLIDALRDAIEADLSGAPEREVRRKAVQELGEFYRINGQRAGMTNEFAGRILGHLTEAEKALPEKPQKKSLLGL